MMLYLGNSQREGLEQRRVGPARPSSGLTRLMRDRATTFDDDGWPLCVWSAAYSERCRGREEQKTSPFECASAPKGAVSVAARGFVVDIQQKTN
jgi:hypothetical protein